MKLLLNFYARATFIMHKIPATNITYADTYNGYNIDTGNLSIFQADEPAINADSLAFAPCMYDISGRRFIDTRRAEQTLASEMLFADAVNAHRASGTML